MLKTQNLAILGATGSIGRSALDVLRNSNGRFRLSAVTAGKNSGELAKIVREYDVPFAGIGDINAAKGLELEVGKAARIFSGPESARRVIEESKPDIVLNGVSGGAGLQGSFAAVRHSSRLALANKESLVMAGELLLAEAGRGGCKIIPVDSEHSAIFQAMQCGTKDEISEITLTASGGPFRKKTIRELRDVTIEEALLHPT